MQMQMQSNANAKQYKCKANGKQMESKWKQSGMMIMPEEYSTMALTANRRITAPTH
jgi:hypothetical protein